MKKIISVGLAFVMVLSAKITTSAQAEINSVIPDVIHKKGLGAN